MCCIFCHNNLINATNPRTKFRKRVISYYKTNEITHIYKHVDANHGQIVKIIQEEMNNLLTGKEERQPTKKRENLFGNSISKFFCYKRFFQKR
jgi:hypothetical protein